MSGDPYTGALHGDDQIEDGVDLAPPIHVASTYDRSGQDELVYRRNHHVTTRRLEAVIGELEGGTAVAYPSGMAAIAGLLRHLAPSRVALPADVYHGTRAFVEAEPHWEVTDDLGTLGRSDVAWLETPSNPRCLITDIAAVAADMRERGVTVAVDSTFATPVLQQPLALGAGYVVHSSTKYIGGHSDVMGGIVVAADPARAADLAAARVRDGSIPGSLDAWLALRGVRTLPLRIERQSATAAAIADHLATRLPTVWYPGLPTHPGREIAARQMRAPGAIVSFELESFEAAQAALGRFEIFRRATSLGGVESLVEHRATVNRHAPPGLLRLSVGLEALGDLITDLDRALGTSP